MKKIKSKAFYEYTKKISIENQFGVQKVPLADFVSYVTDTVPDPLEFALCFDKCQEDWGFTHSLGVYGMQEVIELLVKDPCADDSDWKKEVTEQLETWLKMLKGEDK